MGLTYGEQQSLAQFMDYWLPPDLPQLRILTTGSQLWPEPGSRPIDQALTAVTRLYSDVTVMHGHCDKGADRLVDLWIEEQAEAWQPQGRRIVPVRRPADWPACAPVCRPEHRRQRWNGSWYCPTAGHRRNTEMVQEAAAGKYHACLAFILDRSSGSSRTAEMAEKVKIPVWRCER